MSISSSDLLAKLAELSSSASYPFSDSDSMSWLRMSEMLVGLKASLARSFSKAPKIPDEVAVGPCSGVIGGAGGDLLGDLAAILLVKMFSLLMRVCLPVCLERSCFPLVGLECLLMEKLESHT